MTVKKTKTCLKIRLDKYGLDLLNENYNIIPKNIEDCQTT